jgi:hypothetical protein
MVVMVRHADQRHAPGKPKLLAEDFRHPGHLFEAAAVECRGFGLANQLQTLGKLLEDGAGERSDQRRVVPGGEPCGDIADIATHAAQRGDHRIDRSSRVFRGVLVAGKPFLLVVDDEAGSVRLGDFDERRTGIVHAGQAEADEINRLAARQLVANLRDRVVGEIRAEPMETRHGPGRQPARGMKPRGAEPGVPRSNSSVRFQSASPIGSPVL